jgi:hypothetical protein
VEDPLKLILKNPVCSVYVTKFTFEKRLIAYLEKVGNSHRPQTRVLIDNKAHYVTLPNFSLSQVYQ